MDSKTSALINEILAYCETKEEASEAIDLLEYLVGQGDAEAMMVLASEYHSGHWLEPGTEKAMLLYKEAMSLGSMTAPLAIGYILELNGELEEALKHFLLAADRRCV